MKRILTTLILVVLGTSIWAQNSLSDIAGRLGDFRIKAEFSCEIKTEEAPVTCKGTALAQENMFVVKANGIEAYCDGKVLAMVDPEEKEVYLQDAEGLEEYLKANIGSVTKLKFQELRYLDKSDDISPFTFDVKGLDRKWTVTDLR